MAGNNYEQWPPHWPTCIFAFVFICIFVDVLHMDNYEQWHRHRTIWISLPSVRRSRHCALKPLLVARQCARNVQCAMCNVQCAHYSSSTKAAAQMEPPRMISGLHNAVSRTKSANHGWLSHPWPKCGWCDNSSKLEFISHGLFCLERLFQASEGSDGKFWPE